MLPVLRVNPWVGAKRAKSLVQNAYQIAGNGTFQAYLPHINRGTTSNIVKINLKNTKNMIGRLPLRPPPPGYAPASLYPPGQYLGFFVVGGK